ncbi:cupin domain-containing protein [Streptosporangium lutulentum]|uniref:Mannose-6-phosphate isomerase-like protein (Cupin superfamily) n=1 Tax=Streptosporangium lutulentum TaxID=1461250 RepID=A0ABT9QFJ9_9ACTN|nr:cupin domain-containing protein [Streptosporangium lutulentum]MDP9845459.1 mannose-6-phosphate isomerase-like protein (cupin superfamily) [Streptosporangium lutulentum]
MTYPEPTYFGDKGEISATYRPAAHEPELTYQSGNTVHYLATGASTNGQFGLYRWEMGPEPSGPDRHFHRSISESFFILTGTIRIYDGNRWIDTEPGDFVHVPEGGVHAFRNESGEPASMLLHFAPGAPREGYFEGLAEFAVSGPPSDEELAAFYFRHDTFWL